MNSTVYAICSQAAGTEAPLLERPDAFMAAVDDVLRLGLAGQFATAASDLRALQDTQARSAGERGLCRAILALLALATGDLSTARCRARQAIADTARPAEATPASELHRLRLARALAINAGMLAGDRVRARRAAQARFLASDLNSRWLIAASISSAWSAAPSAARAYARFVVAVHEQVARRERSGPLTPTEIVILRRVATGISSTRVAQLLNRSPHTVRTHLRNAYVKLGARGRADALARAREHGLLEDGDSRT